MRVSLLARQMSFPASIAAQVGCSPAQPTMPAHDRRKQLEKTKRRGAPQAQCLAAALETLPHLAFLLTCDDCSKRTSSWQHSAPAAALDSQNRPPHMAALLTYDDCSPLGVRWRTMRRCMVVLDFSLSLERQGWQQAHERRAGNRRMNAGLATGA